ncbi:tRNA (adenosine(37)-N6)-threonylcarbamoyltransferase complex dimerization subunit type 1 TsaB [Candidatus Omnitrophota bacterium]
MKVLLLDTSSKYLSLAVAHGDRVLSRVHQVLDRKHSLQLVPLIDRVLKRSRVSLAQLDGFCVGRGPGSFTGLRIGLTTIKALSFALDKPIVAIPSLDILVQNIKQIKSHPKRSVTDICAIVDARQKKVYACLYQNKNGRIKRNSRYLLLPIDELLGRLKGEFIFIGDGILPYREKITKARQLKPVFTEERFWYPQAKAAVATARARFQQNKTEDVNKLRPLYLYPKECQIKPRKHKDLRCHPDQLGRK